MPLILLFAVLGIFLIVLGIWIARRPYGRHGVEVDAQCIDIREEDYKTSIDPSDFTYMRDTKLPVYRYWYNGRYYISAPKLRSNRPGYRPELGPCTIRINPDHPERVYSSERKTAAIILISIGAAYVVLAAAAAFIFGRVLMLF